MRDSRARQRDSDSGTLAALMTCWGVVQRESMNQRTDESQEVIDRSLEQRIFGRPSPRVECEHIAALLKTPEEVPPVVACFLGLGAARNGWLVHGSLPGHADVDRAYLTKAGLDVAGLTSRGQLDIMELDLTLSPEDWVRPWSTLLDERLEAGFDALWFARFPVGPDESEIADVVPFEDAWMHSFSGRPVVTLCPYISGGLSADAQLARADDVASVHDRVVDLRGAITSQSQQFGR